MIRSEYKQFSLAKIISSNYKIKIVFYLFRTLWDIVTNTDIMFINFCFCHSLFCFCCLFSCPCHSLFCLYFFNCFLDSCLCYFNSCHNILKTSEYSSRYVNCYCNIAFTISFFLLEFIMFYNTGILTVIFCKLVCLASRSVLLKKSPKRSEEINLNLEKYD